MTETTQFPSGPGRSGGCLCEGVRYEITGPIEPVLHRHCENCRRLTGNFVAASRVSDDDLTISSRGSKSSIRHRRSHRPILGLEWGSLALRAGIHPKVVQERLGYATIGITLDTYSHVAEGMQLEAAEVVADLITHRSA